MVVVAVPAATASAADRDHDRMRDSWEKHYKLNPRKNDARKDKDRDGLRNIDEYRAGTNPRKDDSDRDGVTDDNEGGGRVASFDPATGALTIDLFGGGTLTGRVDATTKIECDDESDDAPATGTTPATGDTRGDGTPEDHARNGADDNATPGSTGSGRGDDDRSGPSDNSGPGNQNQSDDGQQGTSGDDDAQQPACNADSLTVGRTVKEAKLNEGDDGPADVFHELELVR
jgi:hypothetical protein